MLHHHRIEVATGLQISDSHAPWQRGSNKSANIGEFLRLAPAELLDLGPAAPGCGSPRNRSTVRPRRCRTPTSRECSAAARGAGFEPLAERACTSAGSSTSTSGNPIWRAPARRRATKGRARMAFDVDHGYLFGVTVAGPASPSYRTRPDGAGERGVVPCGLDGLLRGNAGRCRGVVRRVSWWVGEGPGPGVGRCRGRACFVGAVLWVGACVIVLTIT
jgi:hypothetical protein